MTFLLCMLSLSLGLAIGYYFRTLYDMVSTLYEDYTERRFATKAGVVKVQRNQATRAEPLDMSTNSGVIMRPTPTQAGLSELQAQRERNARLNNV